MASEVLNALFTAEEEISKALEKASRATESFDNDMTELQTALAEANAQSDGYVEELDDLFRQTMEVNQANEQFERSLEELDDALAKATMGGEATEEEMQNLSRAFSKVNSAEQVLEGRTDNLRNSLAQFQEVADLTDRQVEQLTNSIEMTVPSAQVSDSAITQLRTSILSLGLAGDFADDQLDDVGNQASEMSVQMNQAAASAGALSGQLGFLSAIAKASSFEFSSLSVNIGPFNVALRNILIQLPMILTGMGTLLAVVTSLAAAFATLASTAGAAVLGGAIAKFEEFSGQFEDSAEAVEAFMSALKDLFRDAIEPLTTEANMDLFVDSVNSAARVVNRFSQFFNQMRSDVMGFLSGVGGDMEAFFEALHDSFAIVEDDLLAFINFFVNNAPGALMHFARVTEQMSSSIGPLASSFANLFNQLIDFAQIIIAAVAPVILGVTKLLATLISIINSVNDTVLVLAIQMTALLVVFVKLEGMIVSLIGGFTKLIAVTKAQAAAGSFLANIYYALGTAIKGVILGNLTLSQALTYLKNQMLLNTAVTRFNIKAKWDSVKANAAAATSYSGLSVAVGIATAAVDTFYTVVSLGIYKVLAILITIIAAIVTAMMNWGSLTNWLSGIFQFFMDLITGYIQILAGIYIPVLNLIIALFQAFGQFIGYVIGQLGKLIGRVLKATGVMKSFEAGTSFFKQVLEWLGGWNELINSFIQKLNMIPGVDIGPAIDVGKVQQSLSGEGEEQDSDDVQTSSNVNLSFEDKLEQNVDVTADPEEKERMRRVVKDAMNEANSIARRQQGHPG